MSLKKQAVSGMIWTFSQQFGTQLINFVVGIILARLLLPSDFGVIAMFGVFVAIGTSIVDSGMGASLIRTQNADHRDYSTVFWFNLFSSFIIFILLFLTAPLIANFYGVENLEVYIRIYSISIIFSAFSAIQSTLMVKEMKFKTLFKIRLPSLALSGILAVGMAFYGWGIWSLVFFPIFQSFFSMIQLWFYSKWRPEFIFDKEKFRYHFHFGYKMLLSGIIDTVFKNSYTVIIGKMFSPTQLGYYNRADTLKQIPVANLSAALNSVTFPLFSKISDNDEKLREAYQKIMKSVIFIIAPVLILMLVLAEPLIRFLLTDKWLPAVPYFQVLVIAGILYPIHSYNLNVLKVKGRSDLFLKLEIIKKCLVILVLSISVQFGIMGIVWGQVITSCIGFFINTYFTGKFIDYGPFYQVKDLMPSILLAGLTGLLFFGLDEKILHSLGDLTRLIIVSLGFGTFYLGLAFLMRFREIEFIKDLIKK